jgi:hypothetical protein
MARNQSTDKVIDSISSNDDELSKAPLSITVTRSQLDSATKRYAALKPWIDFANAANAVDRRPESMHEPPQELVRFVERQPVTDYFPRSLILALAKNPEDQAAGLQALDLLGVRVFTALFELATAGERTRLRIDAPSIYAVVVDHGTVRVETLAPFAAFARALAGVQASRIRQCPICDAIFCALRTAKPGRKDASTKACSSRCANAFRVREHRRKQPEYELRRKFKLSGVELQEGLKPKREKLAGAGSDVKSIKMRHSTSTWPQPGGASRPVKNSKGRAKGS